MLTRNEKVMRKAVVFNLGCKVNQYESDILMQELSKLGIEVSSVLSKADFYIINTCAITAEAERKSRQTIKRCLSYNPDARVYIWGCAGELAPKRFNRPNVVCVYGAKNKYRILDIIIKDYNLDSASAYTSTLNKTSRTRAYVKIQDGCNNFCSYCIIPYLRGQSRSRDNKDIIEEIKRLSYTHKEIVITGINLMLFGKDKGTSLAELIRSIEDIDVRIRLGSFYVEGIDRKLLDALFNLKQFSPHFHLSLQSGNDSVLKSMNRHYTTREYMQKVELIRTYDKNASITTDIIVGYPTESEECFENSMEFVKKVAFSDIHLFPFSARPNTKADKLESLPREVIRKRMKKMQEIKRHLQLRYLSDNIKVVQRVLFEEENNGLRRGYSERYIRIYVDTDKDIADVIPYQIYKDGLKGVIKE